MEIMATNLRRSEQGISVLSLCEVDELLLHLLGIPGIHGYKPEDSVLALPEVAELLLHLS